MRSITIDDLLDCDLQAVTVELLGWSRDSSQILIRRGQSGSQPAGLYSMSPDMSQSAIPLFLGQCRNTQVVGNHVVAITRTEGVDRVQAIEISSGECQTLLTRNRIPDGACVSPDLRWMAWVERVTTGNSERTSDPNEKKWPSVHVIDSALPCSPWEKACHLIVCELATGKVSTLYNGNHAIRDLVWVPDSCRLCFTPVRYFGCTYAERLGQVKSLDVQSSQIRTVLSGVGQNLNPSVSPDGAYLAFNCELNDQFYPRFCNMALMPLSSSSAYKVLTDTHYVLSAARWCDDAKQLFFEYQEGVFRQIAGIDLSGHVFFETTTETWKTDVRPAPDGEHIAFIETDRSGLKTISVQGVGRPHSVRSVESSPVLNQCQLGNLKEVHWKNGELTLSGMLVTPWGLDGALSLPLVVDVHGAGPPRNNQSLVTKKLLEWHWWAAQGYCVFAPDYRSSGIYGWKYVQQSRDNRHYGRDDAEDILAGVAMLVDTGIADRQRMAIVGHSAGAFIVNWILTITDQFKAAVSYEGSIEQYLNYGVGGYVGGNAVLESWFGGKPWEVEDRYRANSPMYYFSSIKTPTLLVVGRNETPTYPYEYMFTVLRCMGVDTRLLIYDGEGHVIINRANQRDLLHRVFGWINTRLAGSCEQSAGGDGKPAPQP